MQGWDVWTPIVMATMIHIRLQMSHCEDLNVTYVTLGYVTLMWHRIIQCNICHIENFQQKKLPKMEKHIFSLMIKYLVYVTKTVFYAFLLATIHIFVHLKIFSAHLNVFFDFWKFIFWKFPMWHMSHWQCDICHIGQCDICHIGPMWHL